MILFNEKEQQDAFVLKLINSFTWKGTSNSKVTAMNSIWTTTHITANACMPC